MSQWEFLPWEIGWGTPTASQHKIFGSEKIHKLFLCSWRRLGSNLRSLDLKSDALPTEPPRHPGKRRAEGKRSEGGAHLLQPAHTSRPPSASPPVAPFGTRSRSGRGPAKSAPPRCRSPPSPAHRLHQSLWANRSLESLYRQQLSTISIFYGWTEIVNGWQQINMFLRLNTVNNCKQ